MKLNAFLPKLLLVMLIISALEGKLRQYLFILSKYNFVSIGYGWVDFDFQWGYVTVSQKCTS